MAVRRITSCLGVCHDTCDVAVLFLTLLCLLRCRKLKRRREYTSTPEPNCPFPKLLSRVIRLPVRIGLFKVHEIDSYGYQLN